MSENERNESEQLRLLGMMVKFEKHGTKEKLYELIKKGMAMFKKLHFSLKFISGSTSVKSEAEQMAIDWAGDDEEKLCW